MKMTSKKFYLLSLAALIAISAYPIFMGVVAVRAYIIHGHLTIDDLYQYMIPYTPIAVSLIAVVAFMPLIYKLCKKLTLLAMSVLGTALFLLLESLFERLPVYTNQPLESWQLFLCSYQSFSERLYKDVMFAPDNPTFKMHYYIISIIIILIIINVVLGFYRMIKDQNYGKRPPLLAQMISGAVFIGLCILACCTAFFRDGQLHISPLSAALMSTFFIVYGMTGGIYIGSIFYGGKKMFSQVLPAVVASAVTLVMYIGELTVLQGILYTYGNGAIFDPIAKSPFSVVDVVIIILSGVLTYVVIRWLNEKVANEQIRFL